MNYRKQIMGTSHSEVVYSLAFTCREKDCYCFNARLRVFGIGLINRNLSGARKQIENETHTMALSMGH